MFFINCIDAIFVIITHFPVKRKEAFTQEEVQRLMEDLPQDKTGHTIRLMLATGMRTQEVLALEPQHIEPDGSCIHIDRKSVV